MACSSTCQPRACAMATAWPRAPSSQRGSPRASVPWIGLQQVCRPRLHDAVQEGLQDPGSQARRVGHLRPQCLEFVEPLDEAVPGGRHVKREPHAERKPAVRRQASEEAQILGPSPRVLDRRDPELRGAPQCALEQIRHLRLAWHRQHSVDQLDRSFLEGTGRAARGVPHDAAVRRVGRRQTRSPPRPARASSPSRSVRRSTRSRRAGPAPRRRAARALACHPGTRRRASRDRRSTAAPAASAA